MKAVAFRFLAAAILLASAGDIARAQILSDQHELFQRTFRNPTDVEAMVRYSEVSTRLGDTEAAIGTVERMLFFNPRLARARMELGLLYFRLGSYAVARGHLEMVAEAPDVPPDLRDRALSFIAEIDKRLSPHQWSGFASTGLRYQTNANVGPNDLIVRVLGTPAMVNPLFAKKPDWNWFGMAGVNYVYDWGSQRGDVFEASIQAYYAQQFKLTQFNLGLIEFQAGPRLALFPDSIIGLTVKPYVVAAGALLGEEPYLGAFGGGVSLRYDRQGLIIEQYVEYRRREFRNTNDFPTTANFTGDLWTYAIQAGGPFYGRIWWRARAAFFHNDAVTPFDSYDRASVDVEFPINCDSPFGWVRSWVLTPMAGFSHTSYSGPDPLVDPFVKRRDNEWRLGGRVDAWLNERFGVGVLVQYFKIDSNLPNYTTDNLAVSFGPTVRF